MCVFFVGRMCHSFVGAFVGVMRFGLVLDCFVSVRFCLFSDFVVVGPVGVDMYFGLGLVVDCHRPI